MFRSHRQGLVALTTRGEVQRLPLMARILLCLANAAASVLLTITVIACCRPLAVTALLSSIEMRASWSKRGMGLSPVA